MTNRTRRVCVIGASGKLGTHLVRQCLERGYEVTAVCRAKSTPKLAEFGERITIVPGQTNDPDIIRRAVTDSDGVLTVLVPWGMQHYASGTAQAVLDHADPGARLVFSCGWHVKRDARDRYSRAFLFQVWLGTIVAKLARVVDVDDQVEAARRIFASDRRWTLVRASDLKDGEPQGLPLWVPNVGHPALANNFTHRVDFARWLQAVNAIWSFGGLMARSVFERAGAVVEVASVNRPGSGGGIDFTEG